MRKILIILFISIATNILFAQASPIAISAIRTINDYVNETEECKGEIDCCCCENCINNSLQEAKRKEIKPITNFMYFVLVVVILLSIVGCLIAVIITVIKY